MTEHTSYSIENIQLAWGKVRHRRTAPKVNEFSTGACFTRIRFEKSQRATPVKTGMLGIDRPSIVSLYGRQFGFDRHQRSLPEQATEMQKQVQAQSGNDLTGPIELHTFPKMLGYAFNPVSFWFFHNIAGQCLAVLCEVNNTFGERHFYLLQGENGMPVNKGVTLFADKQFHVSPFFPVKGSYRFRFMDSGNRTVARIDYFDQEELKLTTSVSGELTQPTNLLWLYTMLKYGWFTFMVIAKIHWQALKLLLKGAKFHTKPSPPEKSLTEAKVQL